MRLTVPLLCSLLVLSSAAFARDYDVRNYLGGDFRQCDRRCEQQFGKDAVGKKIGHEHCDCFKDKGRHKLGRIARLYPEVKPEMGESVCGLDGKTYPSFAAAKAVTTPINGGACGQCSNLRDIDLYRKTKNTLSIDTRKCALEYVLLGEPASRRCFEKFGFTKGCNECWVQNMGCTAAHCLKVCFKEKVHHTPQNKPDGSLSDCLACDEMHCGDPFIRCAGANRRRSGIRSDIGRPGETIWNPETGGVMGAAVPAGGKGAAAQPGGK